MVAKEAVDEAPDTCKMPGAKALTRADIDDAGFICRQEKVFLGKDAGVDRIWTMPGAAATVCRMVFSAILAAVVAGAEKVSVTMGEGFKGLATIDGYGIGKAADILWSIIGDKSISDTWMDRALDNRSPQA